MSAEWAVKPIAKGLTRDWQVSFRGSFFHKAPSKAYFAVRNAAQYFCMPIPMPQALTFSKFKFFGWGETRAHNICSKGDVESAVIRFATPDPKPMSNSGHISAETKTDEYPMYPIVLLPASSNIQMEMWRRRNARFTVNRSRKTLTIGAGVEVTRESDTNCLAYWRWPTRRVIEKVSAFYPNAPEAE